MIKYEEDTTRGSTRLPAVRSQKYDGAGLGNRGFDGCALLPLTPLNARTKLIVAACYHLVISSPKARRHHAHKGCSLQQTRCRRCFLLPNAATGGEWESIEVTSPPDSIYHKRNIWLAAAVQAREGTEERVPQRCGRGGIQKRNASTDSMPSTKDMPKKQRRRLKCIFNKGRSHHTLVMLLISSCRLEYSHTQLAVLHRVCFSRPHRRHIQRRALLCYTCFFAFGSC